MEAGVERSSLEKISERGVEFRVDASSSRADDMSIEEGGGFMTRGGPDAGLISYATWRDDGRSRQWAAKSDELFEAE